MPASREDLDRLQREADKYRKSTLLLLEQLDWCVEYLAANHKQALARDLRANRNAIRRRMLGG